MAEQRQPFRFRLPWLAPPQPAPAAPRPSQVTQAVSQPPAQQPPFRPAGVAPAQPPPPARTKPPSPSRSSQGTSKPAPRSQEARVPQGPPGSPSHTVPQIEVTSRPASPAQVSSKLQQTTKALPQSPSPSTPRGGAQPTRTKATTATFPTPPQAKLPSPTKKPPTITTDISQNPKDLKKRETAKTPLEEPKSVLVTTPSPEEQKKQTSYEKPKNKTSTKLNAEVSSPKTEPKPQTVKEIHTASYTEPKQILKGNHNEPKKVLIDRKVIGSHTQSKAHPLADSSEQGQNSEKEVFDIKEVFKKIENRGCDTEKEICGQERVVRNPHKHPNDGGQKAPFSKEIKDLTKFVHKQGTQREKQLLHEKPLSIVTLNGENIGATMHLSSESLKKDRTIPINRGYKLNPDKIAETTTDGEGSSRTRKSGDTSLQEEFKSYVNNNVQGINNSLVFNSTVTERNPGVHMNLSRNPAEPINPGKLGELLNTHKTEVTSTRAEKLTYTPTIRRRCLRSLLLESSDSDPEKPRRHGCRVGCTKKSEDAAIDDL